MAMTGTLQRRALFPAMIHEFVSAVPGLGSGPTRKGLEKRSTRDGDLIVPAWKLCWYPGGR
jgi:hypothetical protein